MGQLACEVKACKLKKVDYLTTENSSIPQLTLDFVFTCKLQLRNLY